MDERGIVRDGECPGPVPACAVKDEDGMSAGGHGSGELGKVAVPRLGIGAGQHEACGCGASGADGSEE